MFVWNHSQATLFTAHAWAGDGKNESFVLISDLLTHNKESVYAFMTYIFRFLRENFELLEEINIFSDGLASSNRNTCSQICMHGNMSMIWSLNGTFLQPPTVKVQWMDLGERSNEQYGGK